MKTQTAVEWLEDCFNRYGAVLKSDFIKAKEIEKEQQDDFAIGFAEWIVKNCNHSKLKTLDYKELLEIYKKEKGL
jgi:hypothetical protein